MKHKCRLLMAHNISQFLDAENDRYSLRGNKEQACTCTYNQAHSIWGIAMLHLKERAAINWGARLIDILQQVCVCRRGH